MRATVSDIVKFLLSRAPDKFFRKHVLQEPLRFGLVATLSSQFDTQWHNRRVLGIDVFQFVESIARHNEFVVID